MNLFFVWWIEIGLVLVWVSKLTFLCWRSKLISFLNLGRKSLGLGVSTQIYFVFVWVVEIDLIQRGGSITC